MTRDELSARAVIAGLGINLDTLRKADYSRIAEVCRNTPGTCFCGCHISELSDPIPHAEPASVLTSPEEGAYNAWGREAAEHVGSITPWADLPPGLKRAWTVALDKAHELTIPNAADIIARHIERIPVTSMPSGSLSAAATGGAALGAVLGMIEMARLLGLLGDDEAQLWKTRAVAVAARG